MKQLLTILALTCVYITGNSQIFGTGTGKPLSGFDFNSDLNISSGYYSANGTSNGPSKNSVGTNLRQDWQHFISYKHYHNNGYSLQLNAPYFQTGSMFFRINNGGTAGKWREIATRESNTFNGDQRVNGSILLGKTYESSCMGSAPIEQGTKTEITEGRIEIARYVPCMGSITGESGATIIEGGTVTAKNGVFSTLDAPNHLYVKSDIVLNSIKRLKIGTGEGQVLMYNVPEHASSYLDYKGNLYFRHDNSYGKSAIALQKDGTVVIGIYPNYGEKRVIDTKGNQLMVNGGIYCESIKVRNDVPKSDYVFEEDYDLKTIEEVEAFVKENKHLPEVPSAKQFEEEGYNVGEMDDLLLRKVEELTLYIVQLKKEINKLKDGE